jgi:hypothetical protein
LLLDGCDHPSHVVGLGHIGLHGERAAACLRDALNDLMKFSVGSRSDSHSCPSLDQCEREGATQPAPAAGDEDDLIFKVNRAFGHRVLALGYSSTP